MASGPEQLVQISQHPRRGKVVVATRSLHAGQTVLCESPMIVFRCRPDSMNGVWKAIAESSPAVQAKILELWSPVDGPKAVGLRQQLAGLPEGRCMEPEKLDFHIKCAMAVNFNAMGVPGAGGFALYDVACRIAHSCIPNSAFLTHDDDASVTVRTMAAVEAGEELTIDYRLTQCFLLDPVHRRQEQMLARREFLCQCPRCTAYGDDTRRFPCAVNPATCPGHHLAHQPTSSQPAELTPCSCCGAAPSAAAAGVILDREADLLRELSRIDAATGAADLRSKVDASLSALRLQPPHPHHAAAVRISMHRYAAAASAGRLGAAAAAAALEAAIECEDAILPRGRTAGRYELLGDTLMKYAGTSRSLLLRAQEAYRAAVQDTLVVGGPSHPACVTLAAKLAGVQALLPAQEQAALANLQACSFCGGPRHDGETLARCGRCRTAAYCCREHQQSQWPLHKKHCRQHMQG